MYEIICVKKTVKKKKLLNAMQKNDIFSIYFDNHNLSTKNIVLLLR